MNALAKTHPPFTSAEFYRMADKGAFAGFRVELRRGMILKMSPQHRPHAHAKADLYLRLLQGVKAAGLQWAVLTEATVSFGDGFEPMPDIVIYDPALAGDASTVPAASVKLIVEIADATLTDDLGEKRVDYAAAGLAEYWVADVQARAVIRHSGPKDGVYAVEEAPAPMSQPLAMLTQPHIVAKVGGGTGA
jgi:Uma2 family endonuclease